MSAHNPNKLSYAQVGNGYRLLDEDEVLHANPSRPLQEIQAWDDCPTPRWDIGGNYGVYQDLTYRTNLTKEQLRHARAQSA